MACLLLLLPPGGLAAAGQAFYQDPLFNAAHDPEFVWHEGEQCWWMTYLQNRYNSPLSDPDDCHGCFYLYTDLGLASTPDNGTTWVYRGVMQGLGAPSAWGNASFGMRQNGSAHGGATWWRPAVTYSPDDKRYHGFFAYLLQSRGESCATTEAQFHVTHYTSSNLLDWKFEAFVATGASRYDSVVFRIKDGRWILVSAGAKPPNLQSHDLRTWEPVSDPGLHFSTDEGPHVTRWKNKMWFNWEPRCDDTNATRNSCEKNVLRSSDGGFSWSQQPVNLFGGDQQSTRYLDTGQAHQGPLLPQGERALVLYFTEVGYKTRWSDLIGQSRSVLQIAPVVEDANGWLHADRTQQVTEPLLPPDPAGTMIDRGPLGPRTQPLVWRIKVEDAMIIALAELNRWTPRWCPDEAVSHDLVAGYQLHAPASCMSYASSAAGCVAACKTNSSCAAVVAVSGAACPKPVPLVKPGQLPPIQRGMQALAPILPAGGVVTGIATAEDCRGSCLRTKGCGSLVFRHVGSSAGEGACGAVNQSCCYLLTETNPRMQKHAGWDSWAAGSGTGSITCGGGLPPKAATWKCCHHIPQRALDTVSDLSVMVAATGSWARDGILTSTVMPWRDQTKVARYFGAPMHSGTSDVWVWKLQTKASLRHRVTGLPLLFNFRVAANGTVLSMTNASTSPPTPLSPLRQFVRDP